MLRVLIVSVLLFGGVSDVSAQQKKPTGAVKKKSVAKPSEIKSKLPPAFNSTPVSYTHLTLPTKRIV